MTNNCPRCNVPRKLHPITAQMVKEATFKIRDAGEFKPFPMVCMFDFSPQEPTPLPFDVRPFTDEDKLEIQL